MKHRALVSTLEAVGKPTITVEVGNGARVLLLPHGGRILGLFANEDAENFYWTHPALRSREEALSLYTRGGWENSGGDRTWLAPELDLFFPHYPDLDMQGYLPPRQLDPGSYRTEQTASSIRMVNRVTLPLFRSHKEAELEITKWVEPAANPLRHERSLSAAGEAVFSGYEQHTSLELLNQSSARLGLWNLIQMPHGGEMIIPTYAKTRPTIYFGTVPQQDLLIEDRLIRFKMCAAGEQKIGLRAVATTGRVGYRYKSDEMWALVIRNFFVNPSGEYIDTPWTDPEEVGYLVQACHVDSGLGSFSELEYHVPAVGEGTGALHREDVSQVWAFRGNRAAINEISNLLLGSTI